MAAAAPVNQGTVPEFSTALRIENEGQRAARIAESKLMAKTVTEGKCPVLTNCEYDGKFTVQIHVYATTAQAIDACIADRQAEQKHIVNGRSKMLIIKSAPPNDKLIEGEHRDLWHHEYFYRAPNTNKKKKKFVVYEFPTSANFACPEEVARIRKLFGATCAEPIKFIKIVDDHPVSAD